MFDNIGGKIMILAKVICWIGIIIFVIVGIVLLSLSNGNPILISTGIACMIVGPLVSWISSFFCYGFGELIENTGYLVSQTNQNDDLSADYSTKDEYNKEQKNVSNLNYAPASKVSEEYIPSFDELVSSGQISDKDLEDFHKHGATL